MLTKEPSKLNASEVKGAMSHTTNPARRESNLLKTARGSSVTFSEDAARVAQALMQSVDGGKGVDMSERVDREQRPVNPARRESGLLKTARGSSVTFSEDAARVAQALMQSVDGGKGVDTADTVPVSQFILSQNRIPASTESVNTSLKSFISTGETAKSFEGDVCSNEKQILESRSNEPLQANSNHKIIELDAERQYLVMSSSLICTGTNPKLT